jgi:hypothetical protein
VAFAINLDGKLELRLVKIHDIFSDTVLPAEANFN